MKRFMKQSIALFLSVVMILGMLTLSVTAANSGSFTDISGSPYAYAIEELGKAGIMSGIGRGRFAPDETVNRAMVVTVLGRMAKATPKDTDKFSDVENGSWYSGYVGWAEENGIVAGDGHDRYMP